MGCGFAEFNAEIITHFLCKRPACGAGKTVMIPLVEFIILRSSPSSKYFAIVIIADKPRAFNESSEQNESIFGQYRLAFYFSCRTKNAPDGYKPSGGRVHAFG